ncbi:MAG: hypothetical protein AAFY28_21325 [Actinomycetota bacterium]
MSTPSDIDPPEHDDTATPADELAELTGVDPDPARVLRIEHEERAAARRLSSIEAGRRKGGALGAAAAGAMLGLRDIYEGPPKDDDVVAVSEAPGDPGDIDEDGIDVTVGDVDVWAPPPSSSSDDAEPPSNGAQV